MHEQKGRANPDRNVDPQYLYFVDPINIFVIPIDLLVSPLDFLSCYYVVIDASIFNITLLMKAGMFRFILRHSGKWTMDKANKQWYYETSADAMGLMIPHGCIYDELLNKVYGSLNLNPACTTVIMKYAVRTFNGSLPIQIKNDDDVNFFVAEIEKPEYRSPLCVETKQNVSYCEDSN